MDCQVDSIGTALGLLEEYESIAQGVLPDNWRIATALGGEKLKYYPRYPGRFMGSNWVDAFDNDQYAWYNRLLDRSWEADQPCFLPNDLNLLAAWAKCNPLDLQAKGAYVLDRFRKTEDGKYIFNAVLLAFYLDSLARYRKTVARSKAANDARWNSNKGLPKESLKNPARTPQGLPKDSQPEPPPPIRKTGERHDAPTLATMLLRKLSVAGGMSLLTAVSESIKLVAEDQGISLTEAAQQLFQKAQLFEATANKACSLLMWFQEGRYNHEPKTWEKGHVERPRGQQVGAALQRQQRNRQAIYEGFGLGAGDGPDAGPGSGPDEPGDHGAGGRVLEGHARAVSAGTD